jgi:VanZ family protein
MAFISYWSSRSVLPIDHYPGWTDVLHRLSHIGGFGALALLDLIALGPRKSFAPSLAWLLVVGFAALDEWHQSFVPGRMGRWEDVVLDATAGALALGVVVLTLRRWPRLSILLAPGRE